MARVYATATDYADYTGLDPVAVAQDFLVGQGLRRASTLVELATLTAVYDTDTDGMPTDAAILAAMRDAVCAQTQFFSETGDITGASAFTSVSIGSVGLSGGAAPMTPSGARARLGPQTVAELLVAGLIGQPVQRP